MSFQIAITPSRRAAGRFIARVRRALQRAVVEEGELHGLNQSKIANAIGVHRSVISRELNGRQDITLGRIGELAWALGRDIEFALVPRQQAERDNRPVEIAGALQVKTSNVGKVKDAVREKAEIYGSTNVKVMEFTA